MAGFSGVEEVFVSVPGGAFALSPIKNPQESVQEGNIIQDNRIV
ncbi:hypothetical protein M23134_02710 [Microscilla marina ATCC 23134]|uniref:Uncharacterized protein n=1 Tax=Microscilla marina ATCC 23134 TaxID=313606 RepID=A1ZZ23_MICM2|nr:hypothetical protein M23134_02710 [Microscilla marina ATCC 23134]